MRLYERVKRMNLVSKIMVFNFVSDNLGMSLVIGGFLVFIILVVIVFFTLRKQTLKNYQAMLYDDEVTELKNANYLRRNFNNIVISFDGDVSFYYINLDNFKNYNDLLGHKLSNQILIEVANRLLNAVAPYKTVYRIHSDHFVVIFPGNKVERERFSSELLLKLKEPYVISIHTMKLTASMGRYDITMTNPRFNDCLLRSELALQEAKSLGKDQMVVYSRNIKRKNSEAFTMYRFIKDALKEGDFFLEYQPIIDTKTKRIVGLESLIRIRHSHEIYFPQEIIAYAEKYHLIDEIDHYVVHESFKAFKRFEKTKYPLEFMSVNISTQEIKNLGFIEYIHEEALQNNIDPSKITVEFTETYYPEDYTREAEFINALKSHGFKVAIDDFGSGYSSMVRLSENQLDKIKIDRAFITNLSNSPTNQKIVAAIVQLSHGFELDVIAEGVENQEDYAILNSLNVKYLQGFLFHKPLSEKTCMKLFKEALTTEKK